MRYEVSSEPKVGLIFTFRLDSKAATDWLTRTIAAHQAARLLAPTGN
jgi:hypothetical protein